jgi:hypothetical protein
MRFSSVALAGSLAILLFAVGGLFASPAASAQPIADTLFTWRGYSQISTTHVAIYPADPQEEERPHTVVLTERAENRGLSTVDDMRFLADAIGREYGVDPAQATWVVRWGAYSFEGARGDKEILLRATFRRTASGRLGSPYWRVITRNDLLELTDRRWRDER